MPDDQDQRASCIPRDAPKILHSKGSEGRTTCFYGNAEDRAGMNRSYNVTGRSGNSRSPGR